MTEAAQTAPPIDARQASMSRVQTQETVLAKLTNPPASEVATEEEPKVEQGKDESGKSKEKPTANERIQELANKRRDAEARAEAAEAKARDLEERVRLLETVAPAKGVDKAPTRADFASEDEYLDAKLDWREEQRRMADEQARDKVKTESLERKFLTAHTKAMEEIEDYAETLTDSTVEIRNPLMPTIKKQPNAPLIFYYLAKNPAEADRLNRLPFDEAVLQVAEFARELSTDSKPIPKDEPLARKPRAPEPINPVKGTPTENPGSPQDFESYRDKRKRELAAKR